MMVMEVPDHPQNEVSPRSTHLMHHIKKSSHLDEKQKTESKNALATSYFGAPFYKSKDSKKPCDDFN